MSPGLIYRYFDNKNAIIQAIIARQIEEGARAIGALHSPDDLTNALLDVFGHWQSGDLPEKNAAQFLDVTAAAAREPDIADMVRTANAECAGHLSQVMHRSATREGFTLDEAELPGRIMLLQCVISGLAVQAIRDPAVKREMLEGPLREFIATLMRP